MVSTALKKLETWLNDNGYAGYDPYDIKGHPYLIRLTEAGNNYYLVAIIREIVFELLYTFPVTSRKVLGVDRKINAKAMALFASSYADLFTLYQQNLYFDKMNECLKWLKKNKSTTSNNQYGWGYPFDWQSSKLIPAQTPNGIVTTAAGEAFWKHYEITKDSDSLNICIGICEFLLTLPIDTVSETGICFSYTPVFVNHVHNLNLFVAEILMKTGMATGNTEWVEIAHKAVNYTIEDQLPDGSYDYYGPAERKKLHIDNYHTGFVLRMLHSIWKLSGRNDVYASLDKCYKHYVENFFENKTIPKLTPQNKYRIDIHSCAESVNCLSVISKDFPVGKEIAKSVLEWTISNLQNKKGYFNYGILKSRFTGVPYKSNIPYIRWGQAWMMKAISSYLLNCPNF